VVVVVEAMVVVLPVLEVLVEEETVKLGPE
jgi:hypothetical protein